MRQVIYILIFFTAFLVAGACINNRANADMDSGERNPQPASLVGRYEGDLPCADCSAISTTLVLKQDRTYSLHYMYVGKSEQLFHRNGRWQIVSDVLHLESEDYNYKISGSKLNQLDLSGKEMSGSLAGKYILTKVE